MEKQYIMLFLLWTKISLIHTEKLLKELPASMKQKKNLAENVCQDLFQDSSLNIRGILRNDQRACQKNILSLGRNTQNLPDISITDRSEGEISFTVPTSKELLLVALVNEYKSNEIIYYSIIKNNTNNDTLYPDATENYTFWSATLSDTGIPSLWKRGPRVQPWEKFRREKYLITHEENIDKQYDIRYKFLEYVNDSDYINAQFWWNSSDPSDLYFDVWNNCVKAVLGNMFYERIGPKSNRSVTLQNMLPLDDTCTIRVKGIYNTTTVLTYHTPACEALPLCEPLPEIPKKLNTETSQQSDSNLWSVHVSWAKQRPAPADYNVTLFTDTIQSVVVPGNATELKFTNVQGYEGQAYSVSVSSRNARGSATSSVEGVFPIWNSTPPSVLMGASWAAALLFVSALLMCVLYVRRRLAAKCPDKIYFPGVLEKIPQEDETEAGSSESCSDDHWEIRSDRLLLHEVIGEGAFGVVRRGTLAPGNKNVAVKMLKDFPSLEEIRSFRSEMELMKSVGCHPHVVSLVGCCSGRRPLIVAEYCSRGDLLSYLRCSWDLMLSRRHAKYYNNNKESSNYRNDPFKNKPDSRFVANRLYELQGVCETELTMLDLLSFCRQIAMGMEFLTSNRVVHRDLAARNILVTADKTLKITDFGLSRDVYQQNLYKQKSNGKMPVKWMALESLTHRIYTTQTDVWSFGVVMWEVVTLGGAPYAGLSAARLPRLLAAGYRMPRPHNCSIQLYQVMLSCWNSRPRSRPTFSELHAALDELLCASADHYLSLSVPEPAPPAAPDVPLSQYVRNLMRGKRWNAKIYERALTAPTNHYTAQPAPLIQT